MEQVARQGRLVTGRGCLGLVAGWLEPEIVLGLEQVTGRLG